MVIAVLLALLGYAGHFIRVMIRRNRIAVRQAKKNNNFKQPKR